MDASSPFPRYVPRSKEQSQILAEAAEVRRSGQSRAVLLYGRGGIGKTRLVRELPDVDEDPRVVWLDPVDVDDSQRWLLSNLERHFAEELDPDGRYFGPYYEYVQALPTHRLMPTSRQTVLDHLNRIKDVFTQCYANYINETGHYVVMTFDTVEAIRGMYVLRALTRWMKALPGTLFILAGRAQAGTEEWWDSIRAALQEPPQELTVTVISLSEFDAEDSLRYLTLIKEETDLTEHEAEKFAHLTQGHPLWLAFTVDYLTKKGMPEEALAPLDEIKADLPYHHPATAAGTARAEDFKRRLVAPYQNGDFWHEAIKRLAIVRESVSRPIWKQIMADRPLPNGLSDLDQAWEQLKATEWIRPRANDRYVTLHDAVAEELTQRVIRLQDTDQRRRTELWSQAAKIYAEQAIERERVLAPRQAAADSRLEAVKFAKETGAAGAADDEKSLIDEIAEIDRWQQELNQLRAAHLFYLLLSDFSKGAEQFVTLFCEARDRHDVLFEDLLAFQLQRFLPSGGDQSTLSDTVGTAIGGFRRWLEGAGQDSYIDIGLEMAAYFIEREQLEAALAMLDRIPAPTDPKRSYTYFNLRGNACMRIPGRVREGGENFLAALAEAHKLGFPEQDGKVADAYKELGFYYRNIGHWQNADEAYQKARDAIAQSLHPGSPPADREELASIHTNWAYVKGVGGRYEDAINLVESAIAVRSKFGRRHEQAISCSVKGEVYRYHRQFKEAWNAYSEALELFGGTSPSWLGVIYQEQAICLFQSVPAGVQLLDPPVVAIDEAERLILESLNLCRAYNRRYYPPALNRAGRIVGSIDPDRGLAYLDEGAEAASELSDGWFWLANLIEYAELCYRAGADDGKPQYLQLIPAIAGRLQQPGAAELEFPELRGRWRILQGHLAMHEAVAGNTEMREVALDHYRSGFPLITHGWVGSYGASAIPAEFKRLSSLAWGLPAEVRAHWRRELYRSWSGQERSATRLLAHLEELY